ncbi:hypothetical protein MTO96_025879 [Rhipicephalus appendiculatus]
MLRALSRCIVPGASNHHRRPPAGTAPDQPTGTSLPLFGALVTYHREAVSARWPLGHALILLTAPWLGHHAYLGNSSLAPYLATHPSMPPPEPFRGLLLSDRHQAEPPQS